MAPTSDDINPKHADRAEAVINTVIDSLIEEFPDIDPVMLIGVLIHKAATFSALLGMTRAGFMDNAGATYDEACIGILVGRGAASE